MEKTLCYPITEKLITTSKSCDKWILFEEIGEPGAHGIIWSVCCNEDCNHVLKYMPYDDNSYESIINEITIQNLCSQINMCPKIEDAWICETGGAIVMELYEMTVKQLLFEFKDDEVRQKILANVIAMLDKLHLKGIYHGDLHLDNIMVKSSSNSKQTKNPLELYNSRDYKYYFIDFGLSGRLYVMDDEHIKNDYSDISAHLRDLIDENPSDPGFIKLYEIFKIHKKKFDY